MNKLILGIDAGNFEGKTVGLYGVDLWKTNISGFTERKVKEVFDEDDMEFEINRRKGLAGTIAKYESRAKSKSMYGASKVHWYTEVRVLLSIFRYAKKYGVKTDNVSLVTGQPYAGHSDEEKTALKMMLKGERTITVNNESMTINIREIGIGPEGVGAFFSSSNPPQSCKILDTGSGTINGISFEDYRVINLNSDTFNYGTETIPSLREVAINAIQDTTSLGWPKEARIFVCGGSAGDIIHHIKDHYNNAEVLAPVHGGKILAPKFANAVGFYALARGTYE